MTKRIFARAAVALLLTIGGAALTVGAVPANADTVPGAPHPAPLCAALNMVQSSPSFYPYAVSDGMDIAMTTISVSGQGINGWNNMFLAVTSSTGSAQSPACTSS